MFCALLQYGATIFIADKLLSLSSSTHTSYILPGTTMASFDAKTKSLMDFLESQAETFPVNAGEYTQMSDLYQRKLWHQLTLLLDAFAASEGTGPQLQPLYETFIIDFKHKLNKLVLARLQVAVSKQLADIQAQTFFCTTAAEEAGKDDRQARSFILCELARLKLDAGEVEETKALLEDAAKASG